MRVVQKPAADLARGGWGAEVERYGGDSGAKSLKMFWLFEFQKN